MIPKRYHSGVEKMVRDVGLEPTNLSVLGPKSKTLASFFVICVCFVFVILILSAIL